MSLFGKAVHSVSYFWIRSNSNSSKCFLERAAIVSLMIAITFVSINLWSSAK